MGILVERYGTSRAAKVTDAGHIFSEGYSLRLGRLCRRLSDPVGQDFRRGRGQGPERWLPASHRRSGQVAIFFAHLRVADSLFCRE
jgi:hypothetical protein